uniref:transposase n=1 Tax=uncultured Paraglaciecola sp. TaxID=1765024 RepID=UPI0025E2800D
YKHSTKRLFIFSFNGVLSHDYSPVPETCAPAQNVLCALKALCSDPCNIVYVTGGINMQTMEKNRLQIMPKEITSSIKPMLTALKNQLEKIDNKLHKLIESCDEYKIKNDIIQSVPGVGKVVAFNLISEIPELGYINNKEASSLVGVAPFNRESGSYKGKRMIRGGRSQIRTAMYMAMMSAIQCNPIFKAIYQRLITAGKPKKVAIIACIRKLVITLNSMVRDGVYWDPKMN